jgi:ABC-type Na+ efflux pump permease subunit
MASTGKGGPSKKGTETPSLKEKGLQVVMGLLQLADKSPNPDIRAAAIDIAKQTVKYEQKQGARLSPPLVLMLLTVLGLGTVSACWYAFLCQRAIANELSGISILLFIVLAAIILFISGTLSQSGMMEVFRLAISQIKTWWGTPQGHSGSGNTPPKE